MDRLHLEISGDTTRIGDNFEASSLFIETSKLLVQEKISDPHGCNIFRGNLRELRIKRLTQICVLPRVGRWTPSIGHLLVQMLR